MSMTSNPSIVSIQPFLPGKYSLEGGWIEPNSQDATFAVTQGTGGKVRLSLGNTMDLAGNLYEFHYNESTNTLDAFSATGPAVTTQFAATASFIQLKLSAGNSLSFIGWIVNGKGLGKASVWFSKNDRVMNVDTVTAEGLTL